MRTSLHCPTCGDTWKRVLHENYLRLGPPKRECHACWTIIPTGAREWADLKFGARAGFFLQNLITLVPPLLLLALAIGICVFFDIIDHDDAKDFLRSGLTYLLEFLLLLWGWAAVQVALSLRRTAQRDKVVEAPGPQTDVPRGAAQS